MWNFNLLFPKIAIKQVSVGKKILLSWWTSFSPRLLSMTPFNCPCALGCPELCLCPRRPWGSLCPRMLCGLPVSQEALEIFACVPGGPVVPRVPGLPLVFPVPEAVGALAKSGPGALWGFAVPSGLGSIPVLGSWDAPVKTIKAPCCARISIPWSLVGNVSFYKFELFSLLQKHPLDR